MLVLHDEDLKGLLIGSVFVVGDKGVCLEQSLVDRISDGYIWSLAHVESIVSCSCKCFSSKLHLFVFFFTFCSTFSLCIDSYSWSS